MPRINSCRNGDAAPLAPRSILPSRAAPARILEGIRDRFRGFALARAGVVQNIEKRFVYVLRSVSDPDRLHVGLTDDVKARLAAHNSGQKPHTAKYAPWRLHAAFWFSSELLAARFGKFLKSGTGRSFAKQHFG